MNHILNFKKTQRVKKNMVIITGATGSGKSAFALKLSKEINGVIINADSMQIYKQIPIITAQPTQTEQNLINHYLYGFIDIFDKKNTYSVGKYILDLENVLTKIEPDKTPIIVGGTMLYIEAILKGLSAIPIIPNEIKKEIQDRYKNKTADEIFEDLNKLDEKYAKIVDKNNIRRLLRGIEVKTATKMSIVDFWKEKKQNTFSNLFEIKKIIIDMPRENLYSRINKRFDKMIENGLIEEMKNVYNYSIKNKIDYYCLPKAIGMNEIFNFFDKKISLELAVDLAKQLSRNYAKRQLTWFRNRFKDFEKVDIYYKY